MKVLESEVFILTVFVASSVQDKLDPNGDNVCLQTETYNDTVLVRTMKPMMKNNKEACGKFKDLFRCEKDTTAWEEVEEPRVIQRSRIVAKCCRGYAEEAGNANCVPVCSGGCLNGACTAPDTCACASGFRGPRCDELVGNETSTQKPTATSTTSTSSSEPSQETESNETFSSETLQNLQSSRTAAEDTTDEDSDEMLTTTFESTSTEREMPTEKTQSEDTSHSANSAQSVVATEETAVEPKNENLSAEEVGLGGDRGSAQSKNLSNEGREVQMNAKGVAELRGARETTTPRDGTSRTSFKGDEMEANENDPENVVIYSTVAVSFTPGMWLLSVVSVLIVMIAAGWMVAHHRRKVREAQMGQKLISFHKEEQVEFPAESLFQVSNILEPPVDLPDLEKDDSTPVLKTFKPITDEKELISTGRCIL